MPNHVDPASLANKAHVVCEYRCGVDEHMGEKLQPSETVQFLYDTDRLRGWPHRTKSLKYIQFFVFFVLYCIVFGSDK